MLQGGSVDKEAVGGGTADAFRSGWKGEKGGFADVWTAMQI